MPPPARACRGPGGVLGDESGAAILEFALVLPILLVLVFGGYEIGRALLLRQAAEAAVRGGARVLARVPDPTCDPACSAGAGRAVALTRDQILANTGLAPDAVRVAPIPVPPGNVAMGAEIAVPVDFPGVLANRLSWNFHVRHQESRVGE